MAKSNVKAVVNWRRRTKLKIIEELGGKCQGCGYNKYPGALHCHHVNPDEKSFSIGVEGIPRAWARIQEEIKKCVLLCSNCHKKEHIGNPHKVNPKGKKILTCTVHGEVPFYTYKKRKAYIDVCAHCSLEKQRARRTQLKKELITSLGGCCRSCNETDFRVLEFHHMGDKTFTIGSLFNNAKKVREEVKKCVLLCANCHHEEHNHQYQDMHG